MDADRAPKVIFDDDLAARRVDQGVGNYDEARYREGDSDDPPATTYHRPTASKRHRSPRGVAYREPSDSDLDEHWNSPVRPATPEEQRLVQLGVNTVRAALSFANEVRAQREGESDSERKLRLAQERARREKREKRLRRGY